MRKLAFVILLTLAAGVAQAHAHLRRSTPAEGSVLMEVPAAILLTFSEAARVTAVWIQKEHEPKQRLVAPTGADAEQISVAIPKLSEGSYMLSWRVLSTDNHIMSGVLHFKVASGRPPTALPMSH